MEQYCILVVDDDREIVRSLGKLLEREGYGVKKLMTAKKPWIFFCLRPFILSSWMS